LDPSISAMVGPRDHDAPQEESPSISWRSVLPTLVAVFIATRLLVVLVAALSETALAPPNPDPSWDQRPIISSLTGSDAVYYLGIAAEGYHLEPVKEGYRDWVFFPLYPMAIRAASVVTLGDLPLAAILVSNVSFLAAMATLYALTRRHLDHERTVRAVTYLAIAPGAVAFSMAYGESLFLLLSVGAFLAAEQRRWAVMGILCALAALTRLPGVLLVIPLFVLQWQAFGRPRLPTIWLALGPLALVGFMAYQGVAIGDPLGFLTAQRAWDIPPLISSETAASSTALFSPLPWLLIGTLLGYTFLFVFMRVDRIRLPYVVYAVVAVATVIASGRLQSVGRYLAVAFPFTWVLANRRAQWFQMAWPIVSAGLFTVHAVLHFTTLAP
jgi:hypothetical protein